MYKQQQNFMTSRIVGFTLLELVITVALIGLLAAIGIPSFKGSLRSNRLTTSANEFISAINLARSEAIKRNQSVSIRKSSTNWEDGWNVLVGASKEKIVKSANDFEPEGEQRDVFGCGDASEKIMAIIKEGRWEKNGR